MKNVIRHWWPVVLGACMGPVHRIFLRWLGGDTFGFPDRSVKLQAFYAECIFCAFLGASISFGVTLAIRALIKEHADKK